MAATVSAWGKPGAWALEAEKEEAADAAAALADSASQDNIRTPFRSSAAVAAAAAEPAEFPSLAAAVAKKTTKKKTKYGLAEFITGQPVTHGAAKFRPSASAAAPEPKGLTTTELLSLPTGPRERTAEELERSSYRGFNSFGGGAGGGRYGDRGGSDEARRPGFGDREGRREGGGGGFERDGPSRADEADDWGSMKRSAAPLTGMDRRERGTGGFFGSESRADDSDTWISKRSGASAPPPPRTGEGFRERRGGFDFHRDGAGPDEDTWGRKREDFGAVGCTPIAGARPRLNLQPRTTPVENGSNGVEQSPVTAAPKTAGSNPFGAARPREEVLAEKGQDPKEIDEKLEPVVKPQENNNVEPPVIVPRTKSSNPFGAARPREEVLAAKGQDWKEIDEKLESMRIREPRPISREGSGFRTGAPPRSDDRTERKWRKDGSTSQTPSPPSSVVKGDDGEVAES